MSKLLVFGVLTVLIISMGACFFLSSTDPVGVDASEELYQGPVPLGYNQTHFRKTGLTIKEVIE